MGFRAARELLRPVSHPSRGWRGYGSGRPRQPHSVVQDIFRTFVSRPSGWASVQLRRRIEGFLRRVGRDQPLVRADRVGADGEQVSGSLPDVPRRRFSGHDRWGNYLLRAPV
jgi:hypothetical protein